MVGVAGEEYEKRGKELAKDLGSSAGKELVNKVAEIIEETMGEKAKKIMLQSLGKEGDDYLKGLNTFRKLVQKNAEAVWEHFDRTGRISGQAMGTLSAQGTALAAQQGRYKAATLLAEGGTMAGRNLSRALSGARWLYVAYQVHEKCKDIKAVWGAPIEGEEQPKKAEEGEAAHE